VLGDIEKFEHEASSIKFDQSRKLCNESVHLTKHIRLVRPEHKMFRIGQTDHMRGRIAGLEGCGGSVCSDRFFGLLSGKIVQLVVVVAVGM
jgi:hypothetical protein